MSMPRVKKPVNEVIREMRGDESETEVKQVLNQALEDFPHIGRNAIDKRTGRHPLIEAVLHPNPNILVLKWLFDKSLHRKHGRRFWGTDPNWDHRDKEGNTALAYAVNFSDFRVDEEKTPGLIAKKQCMKFLLQKLLPNYYNRPGVLDSLAKIAIKAKNAHFFAVQAPHNKKIHCPGSFWLAYKEALKQPQDQQTLDYLHHLINKNYFIYRASELKDLFFSSPINPENNKLLEKFLNTSPHIQFCSKTQQQEIFQEYKKYAISAIREGKISDLTYFCKLFKLLLASKNNSYEDMTPCDVAGIGGVHGIINQSWIELTNVLLKQDSAEQHTRKTHVEELYTALTNNLPPPHKPNSPSLQDDIRHVYRYYHREDIIEFDRENNIFEQARYSVAGAIFYLHLPERRKFFEPHPNAAGEGFARKMISMIHTKQDGKPPSLTREESYIVLRIFMELEEVSPTNFKAIGTAIVNLDNLALAKKFVDWSSKYRSSLQKVLPTDNNSTTSTPVQLYLQAIINKEGNTPALASIMQKCNKATLKFLREEKQFPLIACTAKLELEMRSNQQLTSQSFFSSAQREGSQPQEVSMAAGNSPKIT